MAINKLTKTGYGQIELNKASWKNTGRIEAQCALATGLDTLENGTLVYVNKQAGTVALTGTGILGINYSAEKTYGPTEGRAQDFVVKRGEFLPRIGYPMVGDIITTNTVCYDTTDYTNEAAFITALGGTTAVYFTRHTDGYWLADTTAATTGIGGIGTLSTMPDGQTAVKIQITLV